MRGRTSKEDLFAKEEEDGRRRQLRREVIAAEYAVTKKWRDQMLCTGLAVSTNKQET
jgi:hypothetical protein